ncbi:MAG: hypothetical protein LUO93_11880 [Methanomicrobiales archaeon]|nr:hypothetical protein [Methanomicrobiales archaeon]MDD1679867.1 hypothetical protein [Methanomicrobiales archaeon]
MPTLSEMANGGDLPRFAAFIVFIAIFMAVVDENVVNIALFPLLPPTSG